ncbi:hypothetical protein JD844_005845 [Phrynosoma platyrhinos]|uniref:Uncharacterized protein n=1 Tax=Phrynosoma platyrhinos TaxID=52577 RepID=A0ABQ7TPJ0_PHRPL|nr:hypothetical protein JD844_005845 [Phrynosoma platyrhinos]
MEIFSSTKMDFSGAFSILLAMAISCLVFFHFSSNKKIRSLPPGPTPLPFIGNMLQVDVKELIKSLREVRLWQSPPSQEKNNPNSHFNEDTMSKTTVNLFFAGKRVCLGEGLAIMELFIFLTTILQNFKLKPWEEEKYARRETCIYSPVAERKRVSHLTPISVLTAMDLSGATPLALLLLSALSCLVLYLNRGRKKKGKLPPGPAPLPLVGNLFQLDPKEMHRSLEKLSKQYGPVYTVHLGSLPCVVLCGYQAVKEALVDQADDFSGRGDFPVFYRFTQGNGIAFSNGEKWKVLRRFSLHTLKNFGMGKSSIETRIQEEAQCLVQEFRKTGGAPFNPINLVCRAVSNVICAVTFFSEESIVILSIIPSLPFLQLYNIFPRVMDLLPGPHHQIFQNFENLRHFITERILWHQKDLDPDAPRDFIDCFLVRMEQEKQDPLSYFNMETLVMTTHNLFFGGTETTSTTLRYSFLILMKYPEITCTSPFISPPVCFPIAKVHQEIDQVIGSNRAPCLADRKCMPYTDAVIYEIQRFISILPMGLPRAVTRDTPFRNFLLPEHIIVCVFNTCIFCSSLSGKRICLGAGLARMEIFLFLTTILQHFTLQPLVAPAEIDLTPQCTGLGNVPRPFQFRVLPR